MVGLAAALAIAAVASASSSRRSATVAYVIDGDTIALRGGAHVRLLQIDTPEVGTGECYSRRAAKDLRRMLPDGGSVRLEADPPLDTVDRYGRLLRYVFRGGVNVNLALVSQGDATVWFYDHRRGKYAAKLLEAARRARAEKRGIWGACHTVWDVYGPVTTRPR
jgi:micrococcal nuclease